MTIISIDIAVDDSIDNIAGDFILVAIEDYIDYFKHSERGGARSLKDDLLVREPLHH